MTFLALQASHFADSGIMYVSLIYLNEIRESLFQYKMSLKD